MNDCDQYCHLLVGLVDRELQPQEATAVNDHLRSCAQCRREYEQLLETSGQLEALAFAEPQDEILRQLWRSPFSRLSRLGGWLLVIGGYAALIGYALFELFISDQEGGWVKVSMAAIAIGFLLLLAQAIRERWKTYKKDPYRELER